MIDRLAIMAPFQEEALARAERLGVRNLQLRIGPGFPISTDEDSLEEAERAAEELQRRGFRVVALGFYRNMLDPGHRAAEGARILNVLRMTAEVFHCPVMGVFAGRNPERSIEDNLAEFRAAWRGPAARAEELGVRIAFENCTMFRDYPIRGINMSHTPAAYEIMFEALPSPALGIEFDPSHCLKQLIDPIPFLRQFPGRVFHFHAKDHERLPAEQQRHGVFDARASRDRFPTFGQIDFATILRALVEIGYTGPITIEAPRDPVFASEEESLRALAESVKNLRMMMGEG